MTKRKPTELLHRRSITDLDDLRLQLDHFRPRVFIGDMRAGAMWAALAARYRCSARTVQRHAINGGLWDPMFKPVELTPEQWLTMLRLNTLHPGMPSNWIAESMGVPNEVVKGLLVGRGEGVMPDWLPVWQAILKNPTMHRLHREFAPPVTHPVLEQRYGTTRDSRGRSLVAA